MQLEEWTRRLGASPAKRITASWLGPNAGSTEDKLAAHMTAPNGELPSDHPSSHSAIVGSLPTSRVRQGQAFRGAEEAPSLTAAARDDKAEYGRDGRMLAARSNKRWKERKGQKG
jgi:hypothetical protein